MVKIIFIAVTLILFSQIATSLFGLWSNTFIFSAGVFTLVYWGCSRIILTGGIAIMLAYEALLGQATGNFAVPFALTFTVFWVFCYFVRIHPVRYTGGELKDVAGFLITAAMTYLFFSFSGALWYFVVAGGKDILVPWLIREPVLFFLSAFMSGLIFLTSLRGVVKPLTSLSRKSVK